MVLRDLCRLLILGRLRLPVVRVGGHIRYRQNAHGGRRKDGVRGHRVDLFPQMPEQCRVGRCRGGGGEGWHAGEASVAARQVRDAG